MWFMRLDLNCSLPLRFTQTIALVGSAEKHWQYSGSHLNPPHCGGTASGALPVSGGLRQLLSGPACSQDSSPGLHITLWEDPRHTEWSKRASRKESYLVFYLLIYVRKENTYPIIGGSFDLVSNRDSNAL